MRYTDSVGVEHCVSAKPNYGGNASTAYPLPDTVKAVIPLPHGLGHYEIEDASEPANVNTSRTFEWFLKNHIGSTMLVYASGYGTPGTVKAAYDYRAFGEQIEKVVQTVAGKVIGGKLQENLKEARMMRGIDRLSERDIIEFPESPLDNTNVK